MSARGSSYCQTGARHSLRHALPLSPSSLAAPAAFVLHEEVWESTASLLLPWGSSWLSPLLHQALRPGTSTLHEAILKFWGIHFVNPKFLGVCSSTYIKYPNEWGNFAHNVGNILKYNPRLNRLHWFCKNSQHKCTSCMHQWTPVKTK